MTNELLAQRIAADLFTTGYGERAGRLCLYADDRYLGGWSEAAAAQRIEGVLNEALAAALSADLPETAAQKEQKK